MILQDRDNVVQEDRMKSCCTVLHDRDNVVQEDRMKIVVCDITG